MELADLFVAPLKNEGATGKPANAFCASKDNGKTNPNGNVLYQGAIRHKDFRLCPLGHTAFCLFWRFHICGESFPKLGMKKDLVSH